MTNRISFATICACFKLQDIDKSNPPDAFVVLYSVVDKASFLKAEIELTRLQDADMLRSRPAILVGNKIDLARSRAVSTQGTLHIFYLINHKLWVFRWKMSCLYV